MRRRLCDLEETNKEKQFNTALELEMWKAEQEEQFQRTQAARKSKFVGDQRKWEGRVEHFPILKNSFSRQIQKYQEFQWTIYSQKIPQKLSYKFNINFLFRFKIL